jgi:type I restriction enzyme S subunit
MTKLVPKLRFNGFSEAWEEIKINVLGDIITGNTPKTNDRTNYGNDELFVTPVDISDKRYLTSTKTMLSKKGFNFTRHIDAHSILFVCIGSTIGKVAQNKYKCSTNQQINSIVPFSEYSNDFIYSLMEKNAYLIADMAGHQAVPLINKSDFSSIKLVIPIRVEEQQKIANCLSSLDNLIEVQNKNVEALAKHKTGLMQKLFPTNDEKTPKLRFKGFSGDWNIFKIKETNLNIIDGDRGNNYPKSYEFFNDGFCLFLSAKNITKNGFKLNEKQFISKEKDNLLRKGKLKNLDIIITTRGSIGHIAYNKNIPFKNIRINSGMIILRNDTIDINQEYLYKLLSSNIMQSQIDNISFGSAQPQLTVKDINNLVILFPQPKEQQKIADSLNSIDNLIEVQNKNIQTLKTHKKGLMQQLFVNKEGKI